MHSDKDRSDKEEHFKHAGAQWVAQNYSDQNSIVFDRLRCAQHFVETTRPRSLLDIGCGDGRFLASVTNVERLAGVDHSETMLDLARETCAGLPIELAPFDFDGSTSLAQLGRFDLVSMLGVIHYLRDPLDAVQKLKEVCARDLMITFRNRLYNIVPGSSYRDTELTFRHAACLEEEADFWTSGRTALPNINDDSPRLQKITAAGTYIGLTDPEWNPDQLTHWRQFTPLEALVLLRRAGFEPVDLIPLNVGRKIEGAEHLRQLPDSTSFMALARMTAEG